MDSKLKLPPYQPVGVETEPPPDAAANAAVQIQPRTPITAEYHYESKPNNFLPLSVFTLLCCVCWPAIMCSIIAMIYSSQVDMAWEIGHREGAKQASMKSRNMGIAAIITGIVVLLIIIAVNVAAYELYIRNPNNHVPYGPYN